MKNRYVCPALCRLLGCIGFLAGGLAFFYAMNSVMDLGIELAGFSIGWKGWLLFAASLAVGLFLMATRWSIGVNVKVESEYADYFVSSIWHFLAHGTILWFVLWGLWLNIKLGRMPAKEMVKEWVELEGTLLVIFKVIGWGIAASIASGFISGILYSSVGGVLLGTSIAFLMGAYLQVKVYDIPSNGWILIGIIAAIATVMLSTPMISRDKREREEIRNMHIANS